MAVLELDLERRGGERLDDAADEAQRVFFDDGGQGLAALFAAAALASARRGNGSSFGLIGTEPYAREMLLPGQSPGAFRPDDPIRPRGNSFDPAAVYINAMITSAIVFGMVGVAAGFTWDYVINRGK
ncbi:MAG TPA: hypothetical protein VIW69_16460 [Candidatus Elarobacter sp.]